MTLLLRSCAARHVLMAPQIRGSMPMFWTQVVDMTYLPPTHLIAEPRDLRSVQAATRHFDDLVRDIGFKLYGRLRSGGGLRSDLVHESQQPH